MSYAKHLSFPFRIGKDGRTTNPRNLAEHIRDEVIQLVLTNPGERAFLPQFGGGIRRLVFENVDDAAAGLTKAALTESFTRWLGHRIKLEQLLVVTRDSRLQVTVSYTVVASGESESLEFNAESAL